MKQDQVSQAKDKDLTASLAALKRAARHARELAMNTGTAIVVQRGQGAVRITAKELRKAEARLDAENQHKA